MKLVMLGGTFNPPHFGHMKIGDAVRKQFSFDQLVLVPSYNPAHKEIDHQIPFEQRYAMVDLCAREMDKAFVSDCEFRRKGVSYSIDTIRYLKKEYSVQGKPGLIIGDDLVAGFHRWNKAEELAEEADIIICHRGDPSDLDFPFPHKYFQNPIFEASSTEIRNKVRLGEDCSSLIPDSVLEYIDKEGLYQS